MTHLSFLIINTNLQEREILATKDFTTAKNGYLQWSLQAHARLAVLDKHWTLDPVIIWTNPTCGNFLLLLQYPLLTTLPFLVTLFQLDCSNY